MEDVLQVWGVRVNYKTREVSYNTKGGRFKFRDDFYFSGFDALFCNDFESCGIEKWLPDSRRTYDSLMRKFECNEQQARYILMGHRVDNTYKDHKYFKYFGGDMVDLPDPILANTKLLKQAVRSFEPNGKAVTSCLVSKEGLSEAVRNIFAGVMTGTEIRHLEKYYIKDRLKKSFSKLYAGRWLCCKCAEPSFVKMCQIYGLGLQETLSLAMKMCKCTYRFVDDGFVCKRYKNMNGSVYEKECQQCGYSVK